MHDLVIIAPNWVGDAVMAQPAIAAVRRALPAARIVAAIDQLREPLREEVRVLEDYREAGKVPAGSKGMLWSITYRAADRTLTDQEVNACQVKLVEHLRTALGIDVR